MNGDALLKLVLAVLLALLLVPLFLVALFVPASITMRPAGGVTGFGWLLGLVPLLVLVLVVWVGYLLLTGDEGGDRDPAIRELRAAYARGDLTTEEFEERMQRLRRATSDRRE